MTRSAGHGGGTAIAFGKNGTEVSTVDGTCRGTAKEQVVDSSGIPRKSRTKGKWTLIAGRSVPYIGAGESLFKWQMGESW